MKLNIGVVGFGYFGPNHCRVVQLNPDATLAGICDSLPNNMLKASKLYPNVPVYESVNQLFAQPGLDAVIIATPPLTHCKLATRALQAGLHVLVEKPLAYTAEECSQIGLESYASNRIAMVGHTFAYHPIVRYLANLKSPTYMVSTRTSIPPQQRRDSILWDFLPHDISIANRVFRDKPIRVNAVRTGTGTLQSAMVTMDYAHARVFYAHLSWMTPYKTRRIEIVDRKDAYLFDDVAPWDSKLVHFRASSAPVEDNYRQFAAFTADARSGIKSEVLLPFAEPLANEIAHFVECCYASKTPDTPVKEGADISAIIRAAERSAIRRGEGIAVEY